MTKLFEQLKKGLEEAIAYKKGNLDLRTTIIEVPEAAPRPKSKRAAQKKNHTRQTKTKFMYL